MRKKRTCPIDGQPLRKARLLWGLPSHETFEEVMTGKLPNTIICGCCVPCPTPEWGWKCPKCGWHDYPGKEHYLDEERRLVASFRKKLPRRGAHA